MMKPGSFKKYSILGQVLFWFLILLAFFSEGISWYPFTYALSEALTSTIFLAAAAYLNYLLFLPKLFDQRRFFLYGACLLLLVALLLVSNYFFAKAFLLDYEDYSLEVYMLNYAPYFLLTIGVSSLYRFVEAWFKSVRAKAALENEKLKTELNFLKAQINPHFLFNTLNNIYSYALIGHPDAPEMIRRLSEILRYIVYDCPEDDVALVREVEVAESLFGLYRLKNDEQENLKFEYQGIKSRHRIAPLLVVNLLENAFKHGDALSNPDGYILARIVVDETDRMSLEVRNSRKAGPSLAEGKRKIGLNNLKKQLELTYKDNWELEITEKADSFTVKLGLQLAPQAD